MRNTYIKLYEQADYGQKNHGEQAYDIVQDLKPTSLLDVGCGRGEFCKYIYDNICQEVYAEIQVLQGKQLIKSIKKL